jgi:hypothetical protein
VKSKETTKSKRFKSEKPSYFKRLQKRLENMDPIRFYCELVLLREQAEKDGVDDYALCACNLEYKFGIRRRDLYALADIGALEVHESDQCSEPYFLISEFSDLIINANIPKTDTAG